MNLQVESFYDVATGTVAYVVIDLAGGQAALIDPVLDFDAKSGRTRTVFADRMIAFVRAQRLTVDWILETHAHADHLSAAQYLKHALGGVVAIGEHISDVQGVFKRLFNLEEGFKQDGSQFDHLFADDEQFAIGDLRGRALLVPGHTPADMVYQIGDTVFLGDTLFMPDIGTARCDFPGGNASNLYRSVRKLLDLPAATRLFMCHDYPPDERAPVWQSTVAEQRACNIHVKDGISEEAFVTMRKARDATPEVPLLIIPSVHVNIRAGSMPPPDANGVSYLRMPINAL